MKDILQKIITPSQEFTPLPFWFLNDEPNEGKIRAQLQDYLEKGVNGFVLHPRIGVPKSVPYLSESYFKAVRFIVKTAAELGMKVALYDEAMYPSGSAHGMVVAANPEFASKGIIPVEKTVVRTEPLRQEEVPYRKTSRKRMVTLQVDGRLREGEVITELPGEKLLVYTFTGGNIRGIHFGEDDKEPEAPASADILNPDAVDLFLHLTHDKYYEELKEYFGSTIIAFFTDEPSALGRNAGAFREWLPELETELLAAGGSLAELEGLFSGCENKTTAIYHKLIKKYLREIFYKRLSDWCANHGIALMGHPEASDDVEEAWYFQIPGQDLIMRRVAPESGGLLEFDSVQAKLSADIARHLGRRRNANECFGVCCRENFSWYFTGKDMKWYIDWLGIRGVNLFVPHAFYYSVEGRRSEERPPDVGPNNIWWTHYRKFSDYMKRLSFLMTDSHSGAKVAVLCDNNHVPYKEIACLYENQIDFHYVPLAFLQDAKAENGKLILGEYAYDAVVNVGGEAWSRMVPQEDAQNVRPAMAKEGKELLGDAKLRTVLTEIPCPGLRVAALSKGGEQMYLFSNEGQEAISVKVTLPGECAPGGLKSEKGALIFVDLWRGEVWKEENLSREGAISQRADGQRAAAQEGFCTDFVLTLDAGETRLALFDKRGELAETVPAGKTEVFLGDLSEEFVLQKKHENQAAYSLTLTLDKVTGRESFLVTGEEMAECFCNGQLADVSFASPHSLRIGSCLQQGENKITLVMTGNAANIYNQAGLPFGLP